MRSPRIHIHVCVSLVMTAALFAACSTTSSVPEGDQLYTGIDKIKYEGYERSDHFTTTQEEIEAALACEPNGSLFGSSSYRSPFPISLWIYNRYADSESKFAKWMTKSFGKAPVLMSNVNPGLRASVAQSTLQAHGYFNGWVESKEVPTSNPKKGKLAYKVYMGPLYTLDTITYENFPHDAKLLIDSAATEAKIHPGDPFDVSTLDAERSRIATLFRDNGYFYYQPSYASYLADTFAVPGKVQLRMQMADSLPTQALRQWYIGKVDIYLRKSYLRQIEDSIKRRRYTIHFSGSHPPIRPGVILRDLKLRAGQLYNYTDYLESANKLAANELFSRVDFTFTPRDTSATCDTLDLRLNCTFDRPYDFYIESNLKGKTSGFLGPQLVVGLTKRNAFRGGEKLDINLHGSYEWQTGHAFDSSDSEINSYEYGGDASIELPRLFNPFSKRTWFPTKSLQQSTQTRRDANGNPVRRRRYLLQSTLIKASTNVVNRSGYFKRHIVSGELTYKMQKSPQWMHQFTPLMVEYNYLKNGTEKFFEMLTEHPYLMASMMDMFIPKMKYTVMFSSPARYRNPIFWETSVSEAGNLLSLAYMANGKKWDEHYKELFKNPYAQFLKIETNFTKTWSVSEDSKLVGHLNAGVIWSYGNSEYAPYTEQFWVGGANSVRAFTVRSIGPGNFRSQERRWRYIEQVGDIKFQANLEYRPRLFGNLYGALFLDAGNVWNFDEWYDEDDYDTDFKPSHIFKQMALGTGIGFRYDLDFFVVRLDWGIGLHVPYETGKNGFYNIRKFSDGQSIHLAIGYPF